MRRSPIVVVGTMAGLVGVLSFHSTPAKITLGAITSPTSNGASGAGGPSTTTSAAPAATSTTSPPKSRPKGKPVSSTTTATSSPTPTTTVPPVTTTTVSPTTTTTASTASRTITGPPVNYYFGLLSVKVTVVGKKITSVGIATLSDGGNYRSQQIDQASIPMLEQEAMQAQNANIQSISGASYTSAGFQLSLQDALKKVGL